MAITPGILSTGQITDSQADIYLSAKKSYVTHIDFVKTGGSDQDVTVWSKMAGGTARQIKKFQLTTARPTYVMRGRRQLKDGESIQAQTTTAAVVDFTTWGGTKP